MRRIAVFGMVLALFILTACSPSLEAPTTPGVRGLPDLRLGGAQYLLKTDDERLPIVVHAAEIAIYETSEKAELQSLTFWRSESNGELLFSGSAAYASSDTANHDTRLVGSVEIIDHKRKLTIHAEQLLWLNDLETLVSEAGEEILITTEDDEEILGYGLTLKVNENSLSFAEVVHGVVGL